MQAFEVELHTTNVIAGPKRKDLVMRKSDRSSDKWIWIDLAIAEMDRSSDDRDG